MKRKRLIIALVVLVGIMFVIPSKRILAEGTWKKCETEIEACSEPCPQEDSTHVEPGNNKYVCSCVSGTQYAECETETGSEQGDDYCYAVGTHLGDPDDCSNVTIEWNPTLGGTLYSHVCVVS